MTKISNQYSLTNILTADLANSRLGINNVSPAYSLDLTGTARVTTSAYFATASGSVGIGNTNGTVGTLNVTGRIALTSSLFFSSNLTSEDRWEINVATPANDLYFSRSGVGERMRITSAGNVGIGTSSPGYKLQVSGTGYFSDNLTTAGNMNISGTVTANNLSINSAIYTYNVQQYYYGNCFTFTPPNMLNSSLDNSNMRMYMVWVWGVNGPTEAGVRVWMVAVNGPGTSYTANEILGRDANGGTGLSISRSSATQLQICSNNNAFIKFVSVMQLATGGG